MARQNLARKSEAEITEGPGTYSTEVRDSGDATSWTAVLRIQGPHQTHGTSVEVEVGKLSALLKRR